MNLLTEPTLFIQLTSILVLTGFIGGIAIKLKQPLIVAFILAGILLGSDVLNIVGGSENEVIETLAGFGIALLLFVVGLKLDLKIIKQMGATVLLAGVLQVFITFSLGFVLTLLLGFDMITSVVIGVALTFSSTIIAVKLLSDRRTVDSLYGRLSIGILIIQDLAVIILTIVITAFSGIDNTSLNSIDIIVEPLINAFLLLSFLVVFIRYIATPLTKFLSRNTEFMVLFCISFTVLMAALCEQLNFSQELGGLLAGISLASTPYNNIISARLSTVKDFLLLFFFAHLGANMRFDNIDEQIVPAIVLSVFVLVMKPVIITGILKLLKYKTRTGIMAGLTLSQISEFSLIFMTIALQAKIIGAESLNLIMLIGLTTMGISTYLITYSNSLYKFLEKRFLFLQKEQLSIDLDQNDTEIIGQKNYDVIVFGLGPYGKSMVKNLKKEGLTVLGVDFDPDAIEDARKENIIAMYGDASDPEFLNHVPLKKTKAIIFSFHYYLNSPFMLDLRITLSKSLREYGYKGHIAAAAHHTESNGDLVDHGIDIILNPFDDAAFYAAEHIISTLNKK